MKSATLPCQQVPAPPQQEQQQQTNDDNSSRSNSKSSKTRRRNHRQYYATKRSRRRSSLLSVAAAAGCLLLATTTTTTSALLIVPDPVIHFSVGAVAGAAGAVAAYPFDYVKSQMQTEYGRTTYQNGIDCFTSTITSQNGSNGPLDLYKGVGVQVLGIAPEKGIKLGVNDLLQATALTTFGGVFPLWAQIISGGIAGACQVIASSPLEVLKVGLQTSDMTFGQVWKQVGGVSGLFKGAEACILRDVLFTAILFPLYAAMVQHGDVPTFVAGATSGVVASFAATPPDVIKTRILSQDKWSQQQHKQQTNSEEASLLSMGASMMTAAVNGTATLSPILAVASSPQPQQQQQQLYDYNANEASMTKQQQNTKSNNNNPFHVAKGIIEREGAAVLFSGVTERCVGAVPRFGTTMAMHDVLEHFVSQAGWLSHSIIV